MKIKSEKGITGIDITLSVILIAIFIGILATLSLNIQNNTKQAERHAEALNYAISTIEKVKSLSFSELPAAGNSKITGLEDGYITNGNGKDTPYYRTVTVQDYTELDGNSGAKSEIVKRVAVEISYKYNNKDKTITLSTIKTKE